MIERLQALDRWLLIAANDSHSSRMDKWMVFFTDRFVWFPAYFVMALVLGYLFKRRALLLLPMLGLSILLSDTVSSRIFKPFFARLRPCHDPDLSETLNLVHGCGGQFGFLSSHAANAFSLAVFLILVLPQRFWLVKIVVLLWAVIVSYSRIYLGAHYPSDVAAGTLLGCLAAWGCAELYKIGERRWWPSVPAV
ncbi:phosphatase PAP2 family protein [Hymenobacter sp. BT188]|uniref:phosphatase PAP2 family protein n=1 Tax=Hymenobacter sp. BT188 TaxID=2763504 RepID=UPI00165198E6|nr:phosphatase PAP2 family protein [Hymenobacter sp. BT188]MBC6605856.1 phosphatase PAP2 family protein [Hymenobacter sp. BT188]